MKFYPYKKGGGGEKVGMLKGGTQSFEVVLTRELEVLAIVMGGTTSIHPLKGEGVRKRFGTRNFPIL